MARGPRRNDRPTLKAKVAAAAIKGERAMIELARDLDFHPNQISVAGGVRNAVAGGCRLTQGANLPE